LVLLNWGQRCASLNQIRPPDSYWKICKKYLNICQKYKARLLIMATTAELESVVIHTVQTSQCVGPAANRNAGTNDESPASSSLNQTSEQESELRHRSSHNSETDTQQIDVEQAASEEEILTPGFEGSNKIQGEAHE